MPCPKKRQVTFGLHGVGVAVLKVKHRLWNDSVFLEAFHKQLRPSDESLQGFVGGFDGDAEYSQIVGIDNLRLKAWQIVGVGLMLIETSHFNGLFDHFLIILIILIILITLITLITLTTLIILTTLITLTTLIILNAQTCWGISIPTSIALGRQPMNCSKASRSPLR